MNKPLDPSNYRDIFETSAVGSAILDELVARFGRNPYVPGGIESARQTDFNAGAFEVIQFIIRRINSANNPQETQEHDIDIA